MRTPYPHSTILFLLLSAFLQAQIPTAGLIGAWNFSGNANDVSGGVNHGVVSNASLTADRFGNQNAAYQFNGVNAYITMAAAGPTGSVSRSVSFWSKTNSSNLMAAFDYGTIMVGGCFHILFNYNCPGVGFDVAGGIMIRGNNSLDDNKWHHFAAVYDAGISTQMNNVRLFVDGVFQPNVNCWVTSTTTALGTGNADPITIGRTAGASTRFYNGALDDFYFYDRALTQTEVLQLYNYAPCSVPNPGIIQGDAMICAGSPASFSVQPVGGAVSFVWQLPPGWAGSSASNAITALAGGAGGLVQVAVKNSCGTSASSTLQVFSVPAPTIQLSASSKSSCVGTLVNFAANGAVSYTWQPGNLSGFLVTVVPPATTIYSVTGVSQQGCAGTATMSHHVAECITDASEWENDAFSIFPNPAKTYVYLVLPESANVNIVTQSGKEVAAFTLSKGHHAHDVSRYDIGVYIFHFTVQGRVFSRRLVVE